MPHIALRWNAEIRTYRMLLTYRFSGSKTWTLCRNTISIYLRCVNSVDRVSPKRGNGTSIARDFLAHTLSIGWSPTGALRVKSALFKHAVLPERTFEYVNSDVKPMAFLKVETRPIWREIRVSGRPKLRRLCRRVARSGLKHGRWPRWSLHKVRIDGM